MKIKCSSCNTILRIDESKFNQETIIVQCPSCNQKIRVPLQTKILTGQLSDSGTKSSIEDSFRNQEIASAEVRVNLPKTNSSSLIMYILLVALLFCSCYAIYDIFSKG